MYAEQDVTLQFNTRLKSPHPSPLLNSCFRTAIVVVHLVLQGVSGKSLKEFPKMPVAESLDCPTSTICSAADQNQSS